MFKRPNIFYSNIALFLILLALFTMFLIYLKSATESVYYNSWKKQFQINYKTIVSDKEKTFELTAARLSKMFSTMNNSGTYALAFWKKDKGLNLVQTYADQSIPPEIFSKIKKYASKNIKKDKISIFDLSFEYDKYLAAIIPIKLSDNMESAYLIFYIKDKFLTYFDRSIILIWGVVAVMLAFMMSLYLFCIKGFDKTKTDLEIISQNLTREKNAKKQVRKQLIEQSKQLDIIINISNDSLVISDDQGRVLFWNQAAENLFGYKKEDILGKNFHQYLVPEEFREQAGKAFKAFIQNGDTQHKTLKLNAVSKIHGEIPVELSLWLVRWEGRWRSFGTIRDMTQIYNLEKQLKALAIKDSLTELFNKEYFMKIAEREFARSKRYGHALSLMLIDIDEFASLNKQYGYDAGDHVLKILANIVEHNVRNTDVAARLQGGQLGVLLSDTSMEMAYMAADRLRQAVECTTIPIENNETEEITFTSSIGIAEVSEVTLDIHNLLKRADMALLKAKKAGRNRVKCYLFEEITLVD